MPIRPSNSDAAPTYHLLRHSPGPEDWTLMRNPGEFELSRRKMLIGAVATTATAAAPSVASAQTPRAATAAKPAAASKVSFTVNGQVRSLDVDTRTTLLDAWREHLHLSGTKKGCDHGQCGACTVIVDRRRINACLTLAVMHEGDRITTIEGLGTSVNLHPMQAAFVKHDGYQCGYCTSGQIMSAVALLKEPCGPDDAAVKELMSGNICRCGAYANIVEAIQQVRKQA